MEEVFYERCVYESVDDKSIVLGYISKINVKQNSSKIEQKE